MMDDLNRRLAGLRDRLAYKRKLEASLDVTRASLAYHEARLPELARALERERRDVERLEGLGARAIVAAIVGTRAERIERERRDLLAASLQHHECTHAIASCEADIAELSASIGALGDVDALYSAAIDEKEQAIAESSDPRVGRLMHLTSEMAAVTIQQREAAAAIRAGEEALESLDEVADAIDALLGDTLTSVGTMIVSAPLTTDQRLGDVAEAASEARDALRAFRRELADIGVKAKLKLDLDDLTSRSRSFFGQLYTDAPVRPRARSARHEVDDLREKVEQLVAGAEEQVATLDTRLEILRSERRRTVEAV